MTFEFWAIIGISLGASLVFTILTLLFTKDFIDKEQKLHFSFVRNYIALFVFLSYVFSFVYLFSCRTSLFCGGSLVTILFFLGLIAVYLFIKPHRRKLDKKILLILFNLFAIYLACFLYDNAMFEKANLGKKIEEISLSEEILPDELIISAHDLVNLSTLSNDSKQITAYQVNEKVILNCPSQDYFIIIDGVKAKQYFYSSHLFMQFMRKKHPIELYFKNPKALGIGISDDNTVYFVYALLSKKSLLGKYEVTQYALYNPLTEEMTYSEFPPSFLN